MSNSKRNPRILWTIILFLFLLFVITYGSRLATKAYLEAAIEEQSMRIAVAKERQQALQQQLVYVRSDAYVEETARNELSMTQPGDELLVVVEGPERANTPSEAPEGPTDPPPFWRVWLQQLGL
jgi:cell division protein DivIC